MNDANDDDVDDLLERASALLGIDRITDALALLHQAAGRAPQDARVLRYLSYAYQRDGQCDKSLHFGVEAVRAEPDEEWGHRLCSYALRNVGRTVESLTAAQEAVRLDTESALTLLCLARAELACKFLAEAETTTWRVIALAPDRADTYALLADVNCAQERWTRMEWSARKALEIDPLNTSALHSLAFAVTKIHNERRALPYYVRILETDPTDTHAQKRIIGAVSGLPFWGMTFLTPILTLAMTALGMNGFAAFGVSFAVSFALVALLFRFCPQALLYPQPACRHLPPAHRAFVARTWQKEWLNRSADIACCSFFILIFILIIIAVRFL